MSDYTPTTEEELLNFKSNAELRKTAEFDRWLAEVKAQAWEEGRVAMKKGMTAWNIHHKLPTNPYREVD